MPEGVGVKRQKTCSTESDAKANMKDAVLSANDGESVPVDRDTVFEELSDPSLSENQKTMFQARAKSLRKVTMAREK